MAADIAQVAFIKVWQRRIMFQSYKGLKSYLYRIAHNTSISWLKAEERRNKMEKRFAYMNQEPGQPAWQQLVEVETMRLLHAAINLLPPRRQTVFKMLYVEEKTIKEVAVELKISIESVRDHKRLGLIFMGKVLPIAAYVLLFKP